MSILGKRSFPIGGIHLAVRRNVRRSANGRGGFSFVRRGELWRTRRRERIELAAELTNSPSQTRKGLSRDWEALLCRMATRLLASDSRAHIAIFVDVVLAGSASRPIVHQTSDGYIRRYVGQILHIATHIGHLRRPRTRLEKGWVNF